MYQIDELDFVVQSIILGVAVILFLVFTYYLSVYITDPYKEVVIKWLT